MTKLSSLHQNVIAKIASESSWSHLRVEGTDFVRKASGSGYNARTLAVLRKAGLVESQSFSLWPKRGGRVVGIRLTEAGKAVARRIGDIAEGTAEMDAQGSFIRTVAGFTLEG